MVLPDRPVWLLGCGNMGGAMLRRWIAAGLDPAQVTVIRPSAAPVTDGVTVLAAPPPDRAAPAVLVLAVKPQKLDEALAPLAARVDERTLVISILAGVECASLRRRLPAAGAIVRMMPNMPVGIGKGAIGLFAADDGDDGQRMVLEALAAPLGHHEWIGDETIIDVVTALAGSGPAFLFRFTDALAAAGAALGLPAAQAARLALATIEGAAALAAGAGETPAALARRVASPGGSTRAGLDVLDAEGALHGLIAETLGAAVRRNAELAAAAR